MNSQYMYNVRKYAFNVKIFQHHKSSDKRTENFESELDNSIMFHTNSSNILMLKCKDKDYFAGKSISSTLR